MEWPTPDAEPPGGNLTQRQVVARRIGALLLVAVFLLDVFGDPALVAAVRGMCGL